MILGKYSFLIIRTFQYSAASKQSTWKLIRLNHFLHRARRTQTIDEVDSFLYSSIHEVLSCTHTLHILLIYIETKFHKNNSSMIALLRGFECVIRCVVNCV